MQLAIKVNTLQSRFVCSLCRREEFANEGPQLFLVESGGLVCRECGDQHAPLLSGLLDLAVSARAFVLNDQEQRELSESLASL